MEKLCSDLSLKLKELGYTSVSQVNRAAHPNFPQKEPMAALDFSFSPEKCIRCKKCEQVCCYGARSLDFPHMEVDGKPVQRLRTVCGRMSHRSLESRCTSLKTAEMAI